MSERFKLSLSGMWLIASGVVVVLPIFLPSVDNGGLTGDVIGTSTATMFILSFPSSLLLFTVEALLGVYPRWIGDMYANLLVMFILGLVQWFWIVPRIWRSEPAVQVLNLQPSTNNAVLTEARVDEFFDVRDTTPLERVLRDED